MFVITEKATTRAFSWVNAFMLSIRHDCENFANLRWTFVWSSILHSVHCTKLRVTSLDQAELMYLLFFWYFISMSVSNFEKTNWIFNSLVVIIIQNTRWYFFSFLWVLIFILYILQTTWKETLSLKKLKFSQIFF